MSNVMLKYDMCDDLIRTLTHTYNTMLKYGYTPNEFNASLVTLIPKKSNNLTTPSDFRPQPLHILL